MLSTDTWKLGKGEKGAAESVVLFVFPPFGYSSCLHILLSSVSCCFLVRLQI